MLEPTSKEQLFRWIDYFSFFYLQMVNIRIYAGFGVQRSHLFFILLFFHFYFNRVQPGRNVREVIISGHNMFIFFRFVFDD